MSSGMQGADPEALERLAKDLDAASQRLTTIQKGLTFRLHAAPWKGRGAERFVRDWDGMHRRTVLASAQSLRDAATVLRRNATQQRTASAADGARSGWQALLPAAFVGGKFVMDGRRIFNSVKDVERFVSNVRRHDLRTAMTRLEDRYRNANLASSKLRVWLNHHSRYAAQHGSTIREAGRAGSKVLRIAGGAADMYFGAGEGSNPWHDAATRTSGAMAVSGTLLLATPAAPVGVVLLGVSTVYTVGDLAYEHREEIARGVQWAGEQTSAAAERLAGRAEQTADAVRRMMTPQIVKGFW